MPSLAARAFLLDMDGTLVNSDAVVERVWRRWAARYGLDGSQVYGISHGRQAHDTMADLLPGRARELNLAEARELLDAETADMDGVIPVPGAAAFLAALTNVPHALVTSATDALARARMGAAGLPLPPVLVTAEQVSTGKPAPDGFLKAAAALGVDPADCVACEDSAAGLAAAKAAGMSVIGIGERALAQQPDLHANDFNDLRLETAPDGAVHISVRSRPVSALRRVLRLADERRPQPGVHPVRRDQFVVRAGLGHATVVHHDDPVSARRRGQPVRDHDRGAPRGQRVGRGVHRRLRGQVERGSRLVEQQDVRVGELRSRQCDQLALTGRQVAPPLADLVVVAAGQVRNHRVRAD